MLEEVGALNSLLVLIVRRALFLDLGRGSSLFRNELRLEEFEVTVNWVGGCAGLQICSRIVPQILMLGRFSREIKL